MTGEMPANQQPSSFVKQGEGQSREKQGSDAPAKKEIRRPLKPKDIKFIAAKVANPDLTNTEAAMAATGLTNPGSASVESVRMLKNASLREALDEAMVKAGFSLDAVVAPVKEALEYRDTSRIDPATGEMPDKLSRDEIDLRLRGHDRAIKLMQIANPEAADPNGGNTFNFNFGNQAFVRRND